MYIATKDEYMWNVYIIESGLHVRQGPGGFNVIIKNRIRKESDFSDDFYTLDEEDKSRFLSWFFDTIFAGIEEIVFEKDI